MLLSELWWWRIGRRCWRRRFGDRRDCRRWYGRRWHRRQRWYGRLVSSAKQLVQLFQATVVQTLKGSVDWVKVFSENLTRGGFINTLRCFEAISPPNAFAQIAAWIHRLEPGVRLM